MHNLLNRGFNGDFRAIGRLITLVESNSPLAKDIMKQVYPRTGKAQVIGITGSPGAGKSTFVDRLISQIKADGKKVGVIAIDPSSPFTGGAILGDRLRMQGHSLDGGVFIRSMGSRGHLGGVSKSTHEAALILDSCGFDVILIETVGVGQSEIEIVKIADTVALVLVPGMGDDVQVMKAGIMEIADVFVINKADKEGADKVASDVQLMLKMLGEKEWMPPVCLVSSYKNTGVDEVKKILDDHRRYLYTTEEGRKRRYSQLEMEVEDTLREEISQVVERAWNKSKAKGVLDDLAQRMTDPYTLANEIISKIIKQQ